MKRIKYLVFVMTMFFLLILNVKAYEKTLDDGTYVIKSYINNNYVIDVSGGLMKNESNIQIYKYNGTKAQKFKIKYLSNGYYEILSNANNNYVLDVKAGSYNNYSNIQLYSKNNTNAQKWIIKDVGSGYYSVVSYNNDYCLDLNNGKAENGRNINLYKCNNSNAQKFKFERIFTGGKTIEDGLYTISPSTNNNYSLDINNASFKNGSNISLYDNNNTIAQKFYIKYDNNGYYKILSFYNDTFSLDVTSASNKLGTNVQLYSSNSSNAQKWMIEDLGDGKFVIASKCNNLVLDIAGGNISKNTNVQMYSYNGTNAQKFNIKKTEVLSNKTVEDGYYFIYSSLNSNKVLDISSGTMIENNNVWLYDINSTLAQKWYFKYNNEGYYTISSDKDSSFVLTNNNSNVYIAKNVNNDSQKWYILKNGCNYYFVNKSGKYLDVLYGNTTNKTNIQVYNYNASSSQKFGLRPTVSGVSKKVLANGVYSIASSLNNGMVLDVLGASSNNKTNIQLYKYNASKAQQWKVEYLSNGYYKIVSLLNINKSMDVASASINDGANVWLYDYNNSLAQQWIIKDAGDGYFYIISNANGLYLDVNKGSTSNGTNIQMYTKNASKAQKFRFKKTSDGVKVIDISSHNGNVNWDKVANSDIYGVILRVGVWTSEDSRFYYHLKELKKRNIPYGIYLFSCANEPSHALKEANFVNDVIKSYDINPTLGIYYDLEYWKSSNGTSSDLINTKDKYDNIIRKFIDTVKNKNKSYDVYVYASTSYAEKRFGTYGQSMTKWVAQWSNSCTFKGSYNLWQYTNKGKVDGVSSDSVDISYYYK